MIGSFVVRVLADFQPQHSLERLVRRVEEIESKKKKQSNLSKKIDPAATAAHMNRIFHAVATLQNITIKDISL